MEQLSGGENAILGSVAGGIEVMCNQPILYWKNATQQKLPFTFDPRKLYRGLGASLTNMAVLTGIQFFGAGAIRSLLVSNENEQLNSSQIIASAWLGGALSGIACGPMELIMIQQQRHGGTIISATYNIFNYGLRNGIFRGVVTATGRESIFTAGYLGVAPVIEYELMKYAKYNESNSDKNEYLNRILGNQYFGQIGAAIIAGFIASGLTHPLDTMKTCMQGDIEQRQYRNIVQTWTELYNNQGGMARMYRGFGWRYFRMVLSTFIILRAKETLAPVLYADRFPTITSADTEEEPLYQ